VPSVIGASCPAPRRGMYGPRGRRRPPWGHFPSHVLASLSGRPATLAVTATPITFHGARRRGGKLPPVTVSAVYAQEPSPPPGEEPVEWLLLTSLPGTDFPRACLVVQW
jgi:hypothetical protein